MLMRVCVRNVVRRGLMKESLYFRVSVPAGRPDGAQDLNLDEPPETAKETLSYNLAVGSRYDEWPEKMDGERGQGVFQ